jgi:hypothetical protein
MYKLTYVSAYGPQAYREAGVDIPDTATVDEAHTTAREFANTPLATGRVPYTTQLEHRHAVDGRDDLIGVTFSWWVGGKYADTATRYMAAG